MADFLRTAAGRRLLAVAFGIGLLIRIVAIAQTSALGTPIVDERDYSTLAGNVLAGVGFAWDEGHLTSLRPPLYPAMVAAIWSLDGERSLQAIRAVQLILALMTAAAVYQLGARSFSREVGQLGAAICWLYPSLIFFNFTILTETLFTLLLVMFLLATVRLVQQPGAWLAVACGATLALAALTRSVLWPLPLVFCPMMFFLLEGSLARRLVLVGLILGSYLVVITPWAVRNTRLQGEFTVVDTMGGVNLRAGNYEFTPDDRMWDGISLTGAKSWAFEFYREHEGQSVTEGQRDKWGQRMAMAYMLAHPAQTLRRSLIKFADFWGLEREYMAGIQQGLFSPPLWVAVTAPVLIALTYAVVAMMGAVGFWLAPPAWRIHIVLLLPVLAITGVHTLAFGHSRYHLPLVPIFALYTSALIVRGWPAVHGNRIVLTGAAMSALILVGIWGRQVLLVDAARIRAFF